MSRPRRSLPNTRRATGLLGLLAAALLFGCAAGGGRVTRISGGVRYDGRFINPEAYAAYLLGIEREARGQYAAALLAYLEAHAEDPESPEIWARVGALRCLSSSPASGPTKAQSAFERGIHDDPQYFGNYWERARCAERAGRLEQALADARAAVARRPDDESANLLIARVLQALGRVAEARTWLEAFQAYQGPSARVTRALDSARLSDSAGAAARTSSVLGARSQAFAELRSGRAERARQQAQTELDADPTNSDAWIATLVACDALHDEVCFESTLGLLRAPSLAPSSTALDYLQQLLARRAGAPALF